MSDELAGASSSEEDGEQRRVNRRDALRKAAAGAAWSAPAVKGLSVVPDYAAAGTETTLTRTFRILGVRQDGTTINLNRAEHYLRAIPTTGVTVSGGNPSSFPGQVSGPSSVTVEMTGALGSAGNAVATLQNKTNANPGSTPISTFRADAGSGLGPTANSWYTAPEKIQIPVAFNVDPPFNKCSVSSGTLFSTADSNSSYHFHNLGDSNSVPNEEALPYPNPLPETYPQPTSNYVSTAAVIQPSPALGPKSNPMMVISPTPLPNNPGTFTQEITVENRDNSDNAVQVNRIIEVRFLVTCTT